VVGGRRHEHEQARPPPAKCPDRHTNQARCHSHVISRRATQFRPSKRSCTVRLRVAFRGGGTLHFVWRRAAPRRAVHTHLCRRVRRACSSPAPTSTRGADSPSHPGDPCTTTTTAQQAAAAAQRHTGCSGSLAAGRERRRRQPPVTSLFTGQLTLAAAQQQLPSARRRRRRRQMGAASGRQHTRRWHAATAGTSTNDTLPVCARQRLPPASSRLSTHAAHQA
jgi:hypothetical protein